MASSHVSNRDLTHTHCSLNCYQQLHWFSPHIYSMHIRCTEIFKNSRSHLKIKCHHAKLSPRQRGTHDLCNPDVHYDLVSDAWQKLVPPSKISRAALGCTQYAVAVQCITRNFSSWMNGWSMELTTHLHPISQSRKHSTLLQNQFYLYISTKIFCPPAGSGNQVVVNAHLSPCWWSLLFLVAIWASTLFCHFYSLNINTTV